MCLAGLEASKRIKNATFLKTFMQNLYLPSWMPKLLWLSEDYITIHFPYTTLFQGDYLKRLCIQSPPHRSINMLIASVGITGKQSWRELFNWAILDKIENACGIILKCFDYESVCKVGNDGAIKSWEPVHTALPQMSRGFHQGSRAVFCTQWHFPDSQN